MAGFDKIVITTEGAKLAAKTMEGKILKFSQAKLGSGALADTSISTLKKRTALVTNVMSCDILKAKKTSDTQATISFLLKNTDAPSSFYFKELGIFAIDPDTKQEVLFAYANAGNNAEYINNSISELVQKHIDIVITIDNASNVSIVLDNTPIYVTEDELQDAIKEARDFVGKNYGIRRKVVDNSLSAWERIADNSGLVANATKNGDEVQNDFDSLYPWCEIKRCNLNATTGKVVAYEGEPGFETDGTNGEVMVKVPEFWYQRKIEGDYEYIYISDYARGDYEHSKEFFVGAYDLCITTEGETEKAHSKSGQIAAYNKTIAQFRTLAKAVGTGFQLIDYRYFILQLLYLVEYAHYNSQSMLGNGITGMRVADSDKALIAQNNTNRIIINATGGNQFIIGQMVCIGTSAAWNATVAKDRKITNIEDFSDGAITGKSITFDGAPVNIALNNVIWSSAQVTGQNDILGNKSGCLANDGKHAVSYRGIENIFGNVYKSIDGLNIKDRVAYICRNPASYICDKFDGDYKAIGYVNSTETDTYSKRLGYDENNKEVALPIEVGASSSTGTCDKYYSDAGNRVAFVGGYFLSGTSAGLFFWYLRSASSTSYWGSGARLLYQS